MSDSSSVRLRKFPAPVLPLRALVLSANPRVIEDVIEAAPKALGVVGVEDPEHLRRILARHPVVCAVVVDMDLARLDRGDLLDEIGDRWLQVPTLALLRSSSAGALEAANQHATEHLFAQQHPDIKAAQTHRFLRVALDQQLDWVAALLAAAYGRELRPLAMETLIALIVRQVRRDELAGHLCIAESSVPDRIKGLYNALCPRGGRLPQALTLLLSLRATTGADLLARKLEEMAIEALEDGHQKIGSESA